MHDFFKLYIHPGSTYGLTVTDLSNEFVLRAVKHPILYINARSLRMYHALMHWRIPQHRCTLSANRPATIPTQQCTTQYSFSASVHFTIELIIP